MFLSAKETAAKWNVSETWVTILCKQGRIHGVTKKGNRWYIPVEAKKPEDGLVEASAVLMRMNEILKDVVNGGAT